MSKPTPKALFILDEYAFEMLYGGEAFAQITALCDLLTEPLTALSAPSRPELLREVEVIFTGWGAPVFDESFLEMAPKLRAVFYGAGSVKKIVTSAFWRQDIPISSAYAMNAIPVAEFTVGVILLSLKGVWHYAWQGKQTGERPPWIPVRGGYGSRIGLISFGAIARRVRELLRSFDHEVWVYDPFLSESEASRCEVKRASIEEIFSQCDVISLHAPLLKETTHLIRRRHFELMKERATFINTARGALVYQEEMIEVLCQRPEISAFLDVCDPEPPAPGSPLYRLPNIILTPHIAGSQSTECLRMGMLMVAEFRRWVDGQSLLWSVSQRNIELMA